MNKGQIIPPTLPHKKTNTHIISILLTIVSPVSLIAKKKTIFLSKIKKIKKKNEIKSIYGAISNL